VLIIHEGHIVAQGAPATLRQQLQPGAHLYVAVACAPGSDARGLLAGVAGVESVQPQGEGYTLRIRPGVDARADVVAAVARAGCHLLELRPVAMTLEDIFLDVVGKAHKA
jgi:ABC-type multidrug transport system ATPase subunit